MTIPVVSETAFTLAGGVFSEPWLLDAALATAVIETPSFWLFGYRRAVEWIAEGCNVFNAFVPFYTNVDKTPEYLAVTDEEPDSNQFYWANRLIGA